MTPSSFKTSFQIISTTQALQLSHSLLSQI